MRAPVVARWTSVLALAVAVGLGLRVCNCRVALRHVHGRAEGNGARVHCCQTRLCMVHRLRPLHSLSQTRREFLCVYLPEMHVATETC